jgi:Rrf2 family protein
MKLLTKETDYAIRALLSLAKEYISLKNAKVIAEEENIPYRFLRRILQKLKEEKYIGTKKGLNGGIRLIRDPAEINIKDLIESFQGKIELSSCMFRKKLCDNRKTCVLRKKIKSIEEDVVNKFENITIYDLLKEAGG